MIYDVSLCIKSEVICWISGPYEYWTYTDIIIFRSALILELGENERIETDDGFIGEASQYIRCPKGVAEDYERGMMITDFY